MSIRHPAVAGQFYDADPACLRAHVAALLDSAPAESGPAPAALIVPHAGYVYSGATAARAYRLLEPIRDRIERVVLYGPAHRVPLEGMAVPAVDGFTTPLGDIPLDLASIERAASLPGVVRSDEAHRLEHSLEVQLPFLQSTLGEFSLVPVLVGWCTSQQVATVIDALWGGPETLVVVSTDLSHFHGYDEAQRLDALTCDRIIARDNSLRGEDACGAQVLNGLAASTRAGGLAIELLQRCNSGDTAGDRQRVVGYGAFALR